MDKVCQRPAPNVVAPQRGTHRLDRSDVEQLRSME